MNYTKVSNVRYASADGSLIDMDVTFDDLGEVPFTASMANGEPDYAHELYRRALAGEFGTIESYAAPLKTLEEQRQERKQELSRDYSAAMARLQTGWPTYEVLTWPTQAEEAKAWNVAPDDAKPATPFLTALYETRQSLGLDEPFAGLVGRVTANDKGYTAAVAALTGIRHVAEKNIEASNDPASVSWSFP